MIEFIQRYEEPDGVEYDRIGELDLQNGVISLRNSKGGDYITVLPVSSPEYRKKHHPDTWQDQVKVVITPMAITFNIVDDYGKHYTLIITGDEMKDPIVQKEIENATNPI